MGLLRVAATTAVISGTASAVGGRVQRRQMEAAQQQQAQAQAAAPVAAPVAAAPVVDDQMAQIERLATMHSQGLLTDEEFAAAKAKALGI
jgi:hypothetical protein